MKSKFLRVGIALFALLLVLEVGLRIGGLIYLKNHVQDEVVPGGRHILCLGESTTHGLWLDEQHSYPKQLERKLRAHFNDERITSIVPPHLGQNTSQVANRIENYFELYSPEVVLIMAGVNNSWSFGENHIVDYLPAFSARGLFLRVMTYADKLRVVRLARYLTAVAMTLVIPADRIGLYDQREFVWGMPEGTLFDDYRVLELVKHRTDALLSAWRADMQKIIRVSKHHGAQVVVMTYHTDIGNPALAEFERIAKEEGTELIRNDLIWKSKVTEATLKEYVLHDNWHPNEKGYAIIAETIFNKIVEQGLLLGKSVAISTP